MNYDKFFQLLLIVILILASNLFQLTLIEKMFSQFQAIFLIVLTVFIMLFFLSKIVNKNKSYDVILDFSLLILMLDMYGAVRTYLKFKQLLTYNLLFKRIR